MELSTNKNIDFLLYEKGETFLLTGVSQRGLFQGATDKISKYDEVILTTKFPFESGGLVFYLNSNWLTVSEIQNNNDQDVNIYKVRIRKSNNILTLNIGGILHRIPCIVTDKIALNVDSTTYVTTLDNEIYILVQNDTINNNIKLNDIYKIGRLNYKVVNIDDIVKNGLLYIKLDFSAVPQVFPVYSIEILNGESTTTNIESPVQLNIQIKDGETIFTDPLPIVCVSNNELVATVDSLGYVTPVSIGNCVISVSLEHDASIKDSISLTVDEAPVLDNFTYTLTASYPPITEVKSGQTNKYTAHKFNNGVEVAGLFDWSVIPGTTTADKYVFAILNDTQCTIKANSYTYYIDLFATDRDIPENSISVHIKLRSIM